MFKMAEDTKLKVIASHEFPCEGTDLRTREDKCDS